MIKSFIILLFILFISHILYGQFSFKDDQTDSRIQSGAMEEIDKKFKLEKNNDFELRLFVFPKFSKKSSSLSIFLLSYKNQKWNARLFEEAWSLQKSKEILVKIEGLDSLWEKLSHNEVLTIPNAQKLTDKNGEPILEQLMEDDNSILYSFELISKISVRHYAYKCPLEFSKKYDYIPIFKKVSQIIQLILNHFRIGNKLIC